MYAEVNRKKDKNKKDEDGGILLYSAVNKRKTRKEPEEGPLVYAKVDKTKKKHNKNKDKVLNDSEEPVLYFDVDKKMKNEKKKLKKGEFIFQAEGETSLGFFREN